MVRLKDDKEINDIVKKEINVFFVSNSTCYYFVDELYGLLSAAGYDQVTLALAYYGGCSIKQHYEWIKDSSSNYEFRVIDKNGLHIRSNYSLNDALNEKNWHIISFDNNAATFASGDAQTAIEITEPHFGLLLKYIKDKFPQSRYLWHEVWANEIGYKSAFHMTTKEQRTRVYKAKQSLMNYMTSTYGMEGVPTGDAWEKVRDLPLFNVPHPEIPEATRFSLCSRIENGAFKDDFSHDGDIGGGQYLNACVWFEVLTGESCIGNTFRPQYKYNGRDVSLTEEKILVLQNAAHDAMVEYRHLFCQHLNLHSC